MKCFDVVENSINSVNKNKDTRWEIDNDRLNILKQYCSAIDDIMKEFDGSSIYCYVDSVIRLVTVSIRLIDICIQKDSHVFYDLMSRSVSMNFKSTNDGDLIVSFTFPSVWVDKYGEL